MLNINIPGHGDLSLKHLVFDYNETLAIGGVLIPGVSELIKNSQK